MNGGMDGRMRANGYRAVALCLLATAAAASGGSGRIELAHPSNACESFEFDLRASTAPVAHACPASRSAHRLLAEAESALKRAEWADAEHALGCAARALPRSEAASTQYDIARLRGTLAYRREQFDRALPLYACAAERALKAGDREGYAKMLNNSAAAWRRLGDDARALTLLHESIRVRGTMGYAITGANRMNLADVYEAMGDSDKAEAEYEAAYRAYAAQNDFAEMAHVRQTMATRALARGEHANAKPWLEEAVRLSEPAGAAMRPFRLRLYAAMAALSLREGDSGQARQWVGRGFSLAVAERIAAVPVDLQVQAAHVMAREGDYDGAYRRLRDALAALPAQDIDRQSVLETMAEVQVAAGDSADAIRALHEARAIERALNAKRQQAQTMAVRLRVEQDFAVAAARARAREHAQRLRILAVVLGVTALLVAAAVLRMRWRVRIREATREVQHREEIARYRRLADELRVDRAVVEAALDERDDGVCLLDGCGRILAANRRMAEAFGTGPEAMTGNMFADYLPEDARAPFGEALERLDDGIIDCIDVLGRAGDAGWRIKPSDRRYGDGAIFLQLTPEVMPPMAMPPAAAPTIAACDTETVATIGDHDPLRETFRRALVEVMLSAVDAWERSMQLSRLELAERSRLWRVSIDDGRLRARTMDRYLSLTKLPQNPHWRDVLRTAYFVLEHCPLQDETRAALQARVEQVLDHTRRSAMV
jgi:two-component system, sensor histidine kinase ChiS